MREIANLDARVTVLGDIDESRLDADAEVAVLRIVQWNYSDSGTRWETGGKADLDEALAPSWDLYRFGTEPNRRNLVQRRLLPWSEFSLYIQCKACSRSALVGRD